MSETTVDYHVEPDGSLRAEPTPGPWVVVHDDGQLLIRAGTGNLAGIPDPDDEDEANARLMAEAPGMREDLETIEGIVVGWAAPEDVEAAYTGALRLMRRIHQVAHERLNALETRS